LSERKILIVDDDVAVGSVVKLTLQDRYDVATTTCALSALKYLTGCRVDLILLDIKMPRINGLEALAEIKKRHPGTVVIMMTAYASDENILKAMTLGAYGFISKPFEIEELRSYIDRALSSVCSTEIGDCGSA